MPHASRQDVDRAVALARRAFDEGPSPRATLAERIEAVTPEGYGACLEHKMIHLPAGA